MSGGYRDDRYAIIALGLILLALCLVGLFEATARHYSTQEVAKYQAAYPESANAEEYAPIVASLRDFDPREDTYAQWIMAAFSIIATFVSIGAVVLLKDTLDATRAAVSQAERATNVAERAAADTRLIGEAQVRAYLSIEDVIVENGGAGLHLNLGFTIQNTGQSPAREIEAFVRVDLICSSVDRNTGQYLGPYIALLETRIDLPDAAGGNSSDYPLQASSDLNVVNHIARLGENWENLLGLRIFFVVLAVDVFDLDIEHYAVGSANNLPVYKPVQLARLEQQSQPIALNVDDFRLVGSKYQARMDRRAKS